MKRAPAESLPSAGADEIEGLAGNDALDGGAGPDDIRGGEGDDNIADHARAAPSTDLFLPNAGNVIHGNGGNDVIVIYGRDAGGTNPFGNTAFGDDGDDSLEFAFQADLEADLSDAKPPTGNIFASGGAGDDTLASPRRALRPTALSVTLEGGRPRSHGLDLRSGRQQGRR
ncbi:MAG: hypothetical protein ACXW3P_01510 [Rhodospirillales bacterium]